MTVKTWFQKKTLSGYFLLTCAISLAIGIPLALVAQGKLDWDLLFPILETALEGSSFQPIMHN